VKSRSNNIPAVGFQSLTTFSQKNVMKPVGKKLLFEGSNFASTSQLQKEKVSARRS
jgi:hypothetical protein